MEYWLDSVLDVASRLLRFTLAVELNGEDMGLRMTDCGARVLLVVCRMPCADSRIALAAHTDCPNSLNEVPQASCKSIK